MKTTPVILTTAIISAASLLFTATSGQAEVRTWSGAYIPSSGQTPWTNPGNWFNGVPDTGDTLYFAANNTRRTSNTNDFPDATSFGGIIFGTGAPNYTLAGNALTLTGDIVSQGSATYTISLKTTFANSDVAVVSESGTITFSGTITSVHGFTKEGAGTVVLSASHAITGPLTINDGVVVMNYANALGSGNAMTINSGTLAFGGSVSNKSITFSSLTGSTNAVITNVSTTTNRAGLVIVNTSTDDLFEGDIVDGDFSSIALTKSGTGRLTLTGLMSSVSYNINSTITGGVLQIGNGGTSGTLSSNIINSSILAFNRSDETTYAHNSGGTGKLQQLGTGTLILTGSNTYIGGTDLINGTVVLGSSNAITTSGSGTINFAGGILKHTSDNTRDYSAKFASIEAGKQARIDTNGQAVIYASQISGEGGLEKRGTGSLTLNGVSIYTGATNVSAGTLLVNGSIAASSGVNVAAGGILAGRGTVSNIEGAGTVGNGGGTILTASSINGSSGLDFAFKFTNTIPTFNNAAASGNDLLRLTDSNPFATALNSSNTVTLDFSALSLEMGDSVLGGFFTITDNLGNIENARYQFLGLDGAYGINVTMIQHLANFSGGSVNGYITQFTVVAIPEPTSIAMVLLGGGLVASRMLRRKKAA